ncbi:hypothetical protein B0H14DRAFT_2603945 [Mycena olivaceomarginata]|nr:hypothetical protein B0H14DRAFT_2603945 [Mycena olivaceomarginata]
MRAIIGLSVSARFVTTNNVFIVRAAVLYQVTVEMPFLQCKKQKFFIQKRCHGSGNASGSENGPTPVEMLAAAKRPSTSGNASSSENDPTPAEMPVAAEMPAAVKTAPRQQKCYWQQKCQWQREWRGLLPQARAADDGCTKCLKGEPAHDQLITCILTAYDPVCMPGDKPKLRDQRAIHGIKFRVHARIGEVKDQFSGSIQFWD